MDEAAKEEDKADRQRDDAAVHFGCASQFGSATHYPAYVRRRSLGVSGKSQISKY